MTPKGSRNKRKKDSKKCNGCNVLRRRFKIYKATVVTLKYLSLVTTPSRRDGVGDACLNTCNVAMADVWSLLPYY